MCPTIEFLKSGTVQVFVAVHLFSGGASAYAFGRRRLDHMAIG